MLKQVTLSIALVVAMMAIAVEAKATSITGGISFAGVANPAGGDDWSTATGVDFDNPAMALSGTGTYAGIMFAPTTFQDFTYYPSLNPDPVVHLWSFNWGIKSYSFDLNSLTSVVRGGSEEANSVVVNGMGILHATGYEDTAGTFVFAGTGANGNFTFSASDGAKTSVPEPASVLLLGTGLLGIASMAQRRSKRQKQQF